MPSVVTIGPADVLASAGFSDCADDDGGVAGQDDVAALVWVMTWGLTFSPLADGDVSTWATNPITGTLPESRDASWGGSTERWR